MTEHENYKDIELDSPKLQGGGRIEGCEGIMRGYNQSRYGEH